MQPMRPTLTLGAPRPGNCTVDRLLAMSGTPDTTAVMESSQGGPGGFGGILSFTQLNSLQTSNFVARSETILDSNNSPLPPQTYTLESAATFTYGEVYCWFSPVAFSNGLPLEVFSNMIPFPVSVAFDPGSVRPRPSTPHAGALVSQRGEQERYGRSHNSKLFGNVERWSGFFSDDRKPGGQPDRYKRPRTTGGEPAQPSHLCHNSGRSEQRGVFDHDHHYRPALQY